MIEVLFSESETESMKAAKSIALKHTVSVRTIKDFNGSTPLRIARVQGRL